MRWQEPGLAWGVCPAGVRGRGPPPRPFLDGPPDIVDIKPANMEELTEVITAAEFHPLHCNLFVYSSSKGSLRLCDMRAAALCDKHAKRECLRAGPGRAGAGLVCWAGSSAWWVWFMSDGRGLGVKGAVVDVCGGRGLVCDGRVQCDGRGLQRKVVL